MRTQMTATAVVLGLALAVPAAALSATPVGAAPAKSGLMGNNVTVAPGGIAKPINFRVVYPRNELFTVVLDLTAVSRLADVTPDLNSGLGYSCTQTTTTLTCSVNNGLPADVNISNFIVRVAAHAGVTLGEVADVPARLVSLGATVARDTVRVTVGEGVELAYDGASKGIETGPGRSFGLQLPVRNGGTTPVAGAVAYISKSEELRTPGPGYRNCVYDVYDSGDYTHFYNGGGASMACTFDADLAPGHSYHLATPLSLSLGRDVWAPSTTDGSIGWYTPQDWADLTSKWAKQGLPLGHRGTGSTLGLVEAPAARMAAPPQTDSDGYPSFGEFRVFINGDNRSNLTARGATVTGTVGQTVKVRVSVRNNGPARLDRYLGSSQLMTAVHLPPGVTVVKVPPGCYNGGGPIATPPNIKFEYFCESVEPVFLPRTTDSWEFTVRLDQAMNRSKGQFTTWLLDQYVLARPDPNPSDDRAPIYVTALAPSTGGGNGGGNGGLPITGTNSALLALAGFLLLLTGAGLRMLARRT